MKFSILSKLSIGLLTATVLLTSTVAMARPGDNRGPGGDRGFNQDSSETIVRILYQGLLGRQPEYEGLRTWTQRIVNEGRGSIPTIAGDIASSQEFMDRVRSNDLTAVVENMYLVLLNRSSVRDIQGRITWVDNISRCAQRGDANCLRNTIFSFAVSDEFLNNNVNQILDRAIYTVNYEVSGNLRSDVGSFQAISRERILENCLRRLSDVGFGNSNTQSVYQAVASRNEVMSGRGEAPKSVAEACLFLAYNAKFN